MSLPRPHKIVTETVTCTCPNCGGSKTVRVWRAYPRESRQKTGWAHETCGICDQYGKVTKEVLRQVVLEEVGPDTAQSYQSPHSPDQTL